LVLGGGGGGLFWVFFFFIVKGGFLGGFFVCLGGLVFFFGGGVFGGVVGFWWCLGGLGGGVWGFFFWGGVLFSVPSRRSFRRDFPPLASFPSQTEEKTVALFSEALKKGPSSISPFPSTPVGSSWSVPPSRLRGIPGLVTPKFFSLPPVPFLPPDRPSEGRCRLRVPHGPPPVPHPVSNRETISAKKR